MRQNALVSIVVPMYKSSDFIEETINSVICQIYQKWELIIIDDCSPDDGAGVAIVNRYTLKDSRIRLIRLAVNKGSSGARNEGIQAARGDFIAFLDADDLWIDRFLTEQLDFMKRKNAAIVFSSYKRVDEDNKKELLTPFIVPERVNYKDILKSLPIFPSSAVMDIRKTGKCYFDEAMGCMRDDYVFWLRILKNKVAYAHGNRDVLVSYRMRSDSITANKFKVLLPHWNVLRNEEKISLAKSIFYFSCWVCVSIVKYGR